MSLTKVFNIQANFSPLNKERLGDAFKFWETVRWNIKRMADQAQVPVFFHEFADSAVIQPSLALIFERNMRDKNFSAVDWSILVEMPESLLPAMEKLIYVKSVTEAARPTRRRKQQGLISGPGLDD